MKIGLFIYTGLATEFLGPNANQKHEVPVQKVGKKFFPFFHNLTLDLSWCFYFLCNTAICLVGGYSRSKYRPSQALEHPIL